MYENSYLPEGYLIGTPENREFTSSLAGLERAMACGAILEGMALLCDADYSLTLELGGIRCIIPREECALPTDGEVKDIAVITRVGKAVCFKVMGIKRGADGRPYAILSRKEAQREAMERYLMRLECGDIIPCKVTHLEHFGAFVDVGCGVVSMLSIDCISVSRISHPRDRFSIGARIYAVIRGIDYDSGRIYLSHRELLGTWQENADMFEVGQTVAGIVRSIEDYGIFVELAPNLAGLAERNSADPQLDEIVVGQTAAVYIKSIIRERMKIKLVLIDSYKGELTPRRVRYMCDVSRGSHIDYWRYSPKCCPKVIETCFTVGR